MANIQKRVAAVHDMSGYGRCSLSVIIPILSAMGIQGVPVPTAILSTHFGGFGDVVIKDLTDYIDPAFEHYARQNIQLDSIYTGFLGSEQQIDCCLRAFEANKGALIVVDPVMGDKGVPYKTITDKLQRRMSELVQKADIIVPNLTEAAILLGEEYPQYTLDSQHAKSMLIKLAKLGPDVVIISSAPITGIGKCNIAYDKKTDSFWKVECNFVPASYPGTGDMFSSVIIGGLLNGDSLPIAIERASTFLEIAIKNTYSYSADTRAGVMFEKSLFYLLKNNSYGRFTRF